MNEIDEHLIPLNMFMPRDLDLKEDFRMSTDKKMVQLLPQPNLSFGNPQFNRWSQTRPSRLANSSKVVNLSREVLKKKQQVPQISRIMQSIKKNDTELSRMSSNNSSRRDQFEKMLQQLPVIEGISKQKKVSDVKLDLKEPKLGGNKGVQGEEKFKTGSLRSLKPASIFGEDDMTNFSSKFTFDKNENN